MFFNLICKNSCKNKNKKAQAEMIGLVVIVILLTVGMLFMAQFALNQDQDKKTFTRKGLAYSTMSAIMKAELTCEDSRSGSTKILSIEQDLLEDCAEHYASMGSSSYTYSDYQCSGLHSCEFLNQEVEFILNETLGQWSKNYQLQSSFVSGTNEDQLIYVDNGGCKASSERDSSVPFLIYLKGQGLIESTLYLCD